MRTGIQLRTAPRARWFAASAICALLGTPAAAQTAGAELEELVVTAQRRSENLQNVPMAVSALSAEYLAKNSVRTLEDLTATVPSLVSTNSVNYGAAPLSIRGVGGANGGGNNFGDEPVAVYIDDVYIGRLRVATSDLVDLGSIEVLRGPQGALYGRNATAGALIIRSAAPTNELQGMLRASYTTLDEYRLSGFVSGPLTDTLSGRVAAGYTRKLGWARNSVTGQDIPSGEDVTVRGYLRFEPTQNLQFDLIAEYAESESRIGLLNMADLSLLSDPAAPNTVHPFQKRGDFDDAVEHGRFAFDVPTESQQTSAAVTFKAHWEQPWGSIDSVTGWREWDLSGQQDSDASPLFLFNNNGVFDDAEWSQELRVASNADQRLRWIVGGSYIHENNSIEPFISRNQLSVRGAGIATTFQASHRVDAYSAYLDLAFDLTDTVLLRASGRYSSEEKRIHSHVETRTIRSGPLPAGAIVAGPTVGLAKGSWEDFSPRVVAEFRPVERTMLYVSYTQGFKSGGFNSYAVAGPDEFEPEEITAYEAGAKTDLLSGALRLNASIFTYDYTNLQVRLPVPSGGVNIANAAAAKIQGAEVEAVWAAAPDLRISGNLAYLDARFTEGSLPTVPDAYEFGLPVTQTPEDLDGNRLTRAPKWQYSLTARKTWDIGSAGELAFEAAYRHQDKVFFLETNQDSETYRAGAWGQIDARLDYTTADGRLEVSLFGRNLTDDMRVTQVTSLGGLPAAAINEPRKWGLQVTLRR
ncbi:TonB-dependent receptor [Phenylobacterium sp.]|uniref:TonB-dependent receptor n=1 Tax=Phenylobacterium sp. TaxID=1871053 RepID=UPI0035AFB878